MGLLLMSRPARGAWVEIYIIRYEMELKLSRPARGAWVEIEKIPVTVKVEVSRPARGAWIETLPDSHCRIPP